MTKTKAVGGMLFDGERLHPITVTIRYTWDEKGSTVSLSNEENLMLQVDYEDIRSLVEKQDK